MPCYHPIKAFRSTERSPTTGRYGIVFNSNKALIEGSSFAVPCGKCIGCRLDKAYQWSARCLHESRMHAQSVFITLTYDQQHVPADYSVKLRDWQLFMKKLRHKMPGKIRFLAVGEYGDIGLRPHYHALLFNCDFSDKVYVKQSEYGRVYTSKLLLELWPHGSHEIGSVTQKSADYCARYTLKKQNGDRADPHYTRVSPIDGNTYRVATEFMVMSRRPGIGATWFDKFASDAFPSDFIIIDGQRRKVPRYYLNKLSENEQKPIKRARKRNGLKHRGNNTKARLAVREEIQSLRSKRLFRKLES